MTTKGTLRFNEEQYREHAAKVSRWHKASEVIAASDKPDQRANATDHADAGVAAARQPPSRASSAPLRSGPLAPSPGTLRPAVSAAPESRGRSRDGAARRLAGEIPAPATLVLPWPPSGNTAVRHAQGAHYLRPEVAQYRRHVAALCRHAQSCMGRYHLHVHLSPPDARRRDADNALKSLLDALTHAGVIGDDSMSYMRELHVTVDDARNASAIVRVVPIDDPKEAA